MNIYFGASGFAREVEWLADILYCKNKVDYRPELFVTSDNDNSVGSFLNDKKIISESDLFENYLPGSHNYFVCVGDPSLKSKIVNMIKKESQTHAFPSLVHPDVSFDSRDGMVSFGNGVIICSKTVLTTNIKVEEFVHINISSTVGHDCHLGRYSTVNPNVSISGSVRLGDCVYVGTGAVILQGITICPGAVIGAGAVVTKAITEVGTYVGTPACKIV